MLWIKLWKSCGVYEKRLLIPDEFVTRRRLRMKAHSRQVASEKAKGAAFLQQFPNPPERKGNWSQSALRVMGERYLARQGDKVLETPEGMCWRVAGANASAGEKRGESGEGMGGIARRG